MSLTQIGGIVYPIILSRLFPTIGFRWATRVLGFIALVELAVALAIMLPYAQKARKQQIEQKRSIRDLLDGAPFKDPGFMALSFGFFFMWIGYWVISFFIPTFATFKLGADDTRSNDFLVIFNACSIPGRILPVIITKKWSVPATVPWFAFASGILLFGWIGVTTEAAYYVWVALMSIFLTPLAVLCPGMLAYVSPSKEVMGTRMGIAFGFTSIGVLAGTSVSSAVIDRETGSFWKMQVYTGTTMVVGAALMVFVARDVARKATKPDPRESE
jgi:predicted MFS family arabinose efflux permease